MGSKDDGNKIASWADQLRLAVDASEMTRGEIAVAAEMTEGNLSYFMAGKRGINLATAERIGRVVGVQLVASGRDS